MVWSCQRNSRFLCAVSIAFAAGLLCAPQESQASCGDYAMPSFEHMKNATVPMPGTDHPQRGPCSGPNCSQGSLPQAPIPTSPPPVQDLAALFFLLSEVGPEPSASALQESSEKPAQNGSGVFHPPRLAVVLF
jgi:hypothetical protein